MSVYKILRNNGIKYGIYARGIACVLREAQDKGLIGTDERWMLNEIIHSKILTDEEANLLEYPDELYNFIEIGEKEGIYARGIACFIREVQNEGLISMDNRVVCNKIVHNSKLNFEEMEFLSRNGISSKLNASAKAFEFRPQMRISIE